MTATLVTLRRSRPVPPPCTAPPLCRLACGRSCGSRARPPSPRRSRSTPTPASPGRCSPFCILAPDLAMLPYLIGPRAGACAYNLVHTYALALPFAVRRLCVRLARRHGDRPHLARPHRHGPHARLRPQIRKRLRRHPSRPLRKELSDPMRVHAIQTGRVRIKTSQIVGRGHGLKRRLAPLIDNEWSPWLPTLVYAIEHRDGVILVDAGASAAHKSLPRWHPYFRNAVRFDIEPEQEAGPQLRALGIGSGDVRRVVLTHLHIDHDGGLGAFPASEVLVSPGELRRASGIAGRLRGYLPQRWPKQLRSEASRPRRRRLWPVCALEAPDRRRRDRRRRHARPYARSFLGHRRGRRQDRLHRRRRLLQRGDDACWRDRRRERGRKRRRRRRSRPSGPSPRRGRRSICRRTIRRRRRDSRSGGRLARLSPSPHAPPLLVKQPRRPLSASGSARAAGRRRAR